MYKISMITGDGVGPELADSAQAVLEAAVAGTNVGLEIIRVAAGDGALADTGAALPQKTIDAIKNSDACLKAPVGESAADVIVVLRQMLDLYANIRPAKSYRQLPSIVDGVDMVLVRENTEDLYTGDEFLVGGGGGGEGDDDEAAAVALRVITRKASHRIAKHAFETAAKRKKKVTCVHKSNVMRVTDGLFARACADVSKEYPDIVLENMYVDACAMNLVRRPQEFDVIVTTNLFGDILSDESSQVVGGLGAAPAANIGDDYALFEPVHGAAFDIAGTGIVNPLSIILSCKMMLEWLGDRHDNPSCIDIARQIESAAFATLDDGIRTPDIGGSNSTAEFTDRIVKRLGNV